MPNYLMLYVLIVNLFHPCLVPGSLISEEGNEPRYEKTGFFAYAKTKTQISFAVTAKLISAFVFATGIIQSLYFLNMKFQASSHLLWLYSPVCVGRGQKPRRPVFSQRGSSHFLSDTKTLAIFSEVSTDRYEQRSTLILLNELPHEKTCASGKQRRRSAVQ